MRGGFRFSNIAKSGEPALSYTTETYGRYEIKIGPLRAEWGANAFRRKKLIAKASGSTKQDAVQNLKAELDRLDKIELSERNIEGAPSARIYERAFIEIDPLPDSYRAMLRAHLHATDHLISATKLAEAAGYAGYEGANLHYGILGQKLAQEIGFTPPERADGTKIWTCAIARDPNSDLEFPDSSLMETLLRKMDIAHFEWQMRPQVVEALRALGY